MGGTGTETALAAAESVPLVDTRTSTSRSTSSSDDLTGGIDLLAALQLYNTTRMGVTQVPGLARLLPAYYLQGIRFIIYIINSRSISWNAVL